tara:strand:- start:18 stop:143 length:126 start_codon:yes stop_codon:yes gene_type:complete
MARFLGCRAACCLNSPPPSMPRGQLQTTVQTRPTAAIYIVE